MRNELKIFIVLILALAGVFYLKGTKSELCNLFSNEERQVSKHIAVETVIESADKDEAFKITVSDEDTEQAEIDAQRKEYETSILKQLDELEAEVGAEKLSEVAVAKLELAREKFVLLEEWELLDDEVKVDERGQKIYTGSSAMKFLSTINNQEEADINTDALKGLIGGDQ